MINPIPDGSLGGEMHMTYTPSIAEWTEGAVKVRIVVPPGEETDYSSIPDTGLLGWVARKRGFIKSKDYFTRNGKIHDELYWAIKARGGYLPDGWYQFYNPVKQEWEPILNKHWERREADEIWRRVGIEDGCPEALANEGYAWLRMFGGIHMFFH